MDGIYANSFSGPKSYRDHGVICELSKLSVLDFVSSLFCYERIFSGYSGFPLSTKTKV